MPDRAPFLDSPGSENPAAAASPPAERGFRESLLAMLGLCLILIMVALDQTVVGTALPTVVAELKGFGLYAWVATAYLLTSVVTVPIFGRLGDQHGRKSFVLMAIGVFTLASMLCGAARDMLQLVLARALQGVGGGMLVATAYASIPDLFPDARRRLRWQVMFSSAFGLANAIGPSLGGFLTQSLGWRWVFFVNLPIGLLSLWCVARYLPRIRHQARAPRRLDWLGALLIALLLGSLQLLVEWLPEHKPALWLAGLSLLALAAGVMLLWWEKRCEDPILPLEMFRHPSLAPLFLMSLLMGACMFAVLVYAPLLFQGGFGLSPRDAGLLVTPLVVCITVGSIVNGRVVPRLRRANGLLHAGFLLFGTAALGLSRVGALTPHGWVVLIMMLGDFGLGLLLPNLTLFAQETAVRTQLGIATAMLQSTRMMGGMLGTALVGSFINHRYAQSLAQPQAAAFRAWLADPQILVDPALARRFAAAAGDAAGPLLQLARQSLVGAVHSGQLLVAAILLLAPWLVVRRLPPISLKAKPHTEST